jgi:DNA-binding Lrp family transcriptional regulator
MDTVMAALTLQELDTQLLATVQEQVPLSARPYAAIAAALDAPETLVTERLAALHSGPRAVIRQIGAIFDSKRLGYRSTLVAAKVPEDQLDHAATVINAHPGVSHNYRRDHDYNLWFTLAVPPDSILGLERTAEILKHRFGATALRLLPTIKMYKIGVKLDLGAAPSGPSTPAPKHRHTSSLDALTTKDKRLIRILQRDLPILDRPFDAWAAEAGVSVDDLLIAAERFREAGLMRRFSAVLRHRELGFDANAMGVWIVPESHQDSFGLTAAAIPEVSHCYLRPSYPDWPYNIFTMIHTRERTEGTTILSQIAAATGINDYSALYSTHEYKKVRIQYFENDIPAWEAKAAGAA